jgi:predicted outer membrane repeat protein
MKRILHVFMVLAFMFVALIAQAQTTYFVKHDATGDNDGSSWTHAFTTVQAALDVAVSGDEIWVAAGTYKPLQDYDLGDESDARLYHFRMIEGVEIYGGFEGTEDPNTFDLADRDFVSNETILSGDIGIEDVNSDNCYHVFFHPSGLGLTNAAVLDGFTITRGYADDTNPHDEGAGMHNDDNSPLIRNCTFEFNFAEQRGGAMFNIGASNPGLFGCNFNNNEAYYSHGGAIYNIYLEDGVMIIDDCDFTSNTASSGAGGAIYTYVGELEISNSNFSGNIALDGGAIFNYYETSPTITDCNFELNEASYGGAIYNDDNCSPIITNTTFESNVASSYGGAIYNEYNSNPIITNCDFLSNSSEYGGAIYNVDYSIPDISGSTFSGNEAEYRGGALYFQDYVEIDIEECIFEFNSAEDGGAIFLYYDVQLNLIDCEFTENETSYDGGAIYCYEYNILNITGGIFEKNTATNGGAIFLDEDSQSYISDCEFINNEASDYGGAIYCYYYTTLYLTGGTFGNNSANSDGGAIYCYYYSEVDIESCTFENNSADYYGGAISCEYDVELYIEESSFDNNTAEYSGGAIYLYDYIYTYIINSFFTNNSSDDGGAIYGEDLNTTSFWNCVFASNTAVDGGGAMYFYDCEVYLTNCTIYGNSAVNGGGIFADEDSYINLDNSIIWGNTASGLGNQIYIYYYADVNMDYSCYSDETNDIYNDGDFDVYDSITDDPLFVDAGNGDLRVFGKSPVVDAGYDSYNSEAFDIRGDGFPRKLDGTDYTQVGTIDMGAFEYNSDTDPSGPTHFVKHDATGDNDGSSWDDAFTSFQSALDVATSGDHIWVATGTYKPSTDHDLGDESDARFYHFRMIDGVQIYGGFAGTENPNLFDLADRDFVTNETILSGDLNGDDDFDVTNDGYQGTTGDENCYHVLFHPSGYGLTEAAVIDGFTITGGNADGLDGLHDLGGGIYNYQNEPIFRNLILRDNYADGGGAMYIYNCSPIITNALIVNNVSDFGGAIWIREFAIPILTNVTIARNHGYYGGGIFINGFSDPVMNNSIIWGNTSDDSGRQVYISSVSTLTLNYCNYSDELGDILVSQFATFIALNSITDNPLFVDAANEDFRLFGVSPAVDAGDNSYNSETSDVRGQDRIQNTTIDMGAFEWTEGVDPLCPSNVFVSDDFDNETVGWGSTYFDNLADALNVACADATVNISNYAHTGDVDMTGYTFIIGDSDFDLDGNLTGGLIQTPSTGRLILPAEQNVQQDFPMGDGNNNYTLKIICENIPTNPIRVRLKEQSVPGAIKDPMQFWDIEGDDDLDATIIFRIDKSAIAPKTLNTNSILRFYDGEKYLPMAENQVTINDKGTYYEIIIINVNQF